MKRKAGLLAVPIAFGGGGDAAAFAAAPTVKPPGGIQAFDGQAKERYLGLCDAKPIRYGDHADPSGLSNERAVAGASAAGRFIRSLGGSVSLLMAPHAYLTDQNH